LTAEDWRANCPEVANYPENVAQASAAFTYPVNYSGNYMMKLLLIKGFSVSLA